MLTRGACRHNGRFCLVGCSAISALSSSRRIHFWWAVACPSNSNICIRWSCGSGPVVTRGSSSVEAPGFFSFFFRPDWVGLFGSEDLMTRFPGSLDPFLTPMTVVRGWCGCPGIAGDPIRASAVGCAHHTFFGRGLGALHHGRRSSGNIRHRLKSPPI